MNLRTIKKLSKRAAPLLPRLGDNRKQFRARPYDSYGLGALVTDRKHWERSRVHPSYEPRNNWVTPRRQRGHEIMFQARSGHHIVMRPPTNPRRGTIMVGGTSGYYEPEWDEETAWSALTDIVYAHYTDWSESGPCKLTRPLDTITQIFAAAEELAAEMDADRESRATQYGQTSIQHRAELIPQSELMASMADEETEECEF